MNTFGISLFEEPQHFIALYLGIKVQTELFLKHLEKLMHRTKSPPLALTYTHHFLKDKSEEELSLDIIRFVSQLADLSTGVSMASSLHGILQESSFLTELRHNLTHKTMVKGSILSLAKRLILKELEQKYWQVTIQKLKQTYNLNLSLIETYYQQIYDSPYGDDLSWLKISHSLDFFHQCSNYEYKQHISEVISNFKLGKISKQTIDQHVKNESYQKQAIFTVILLQEYMRDAEAEHFCHYVVNVAQNINDQLFGNEIVKRELLKSYFFRYLGHANKLYQSLEQKYQEDIQKFWREKESQIGQLYEK